MALITTTASLIRQYNAFTGLSATERSQSGIARAEIVYYNVNDDWDAPGSGNIREYTSGTIDLPKDFGYVLTDAYISVKGGSVIKAEAAAAFDIFVGGSLGPQINFVLPSAPSRQQQAGTTAIGSIAADAYNTVYPTFGANGVMRYALQDKPTTLIYPFQSGTYTSTPNPASQFRFSIGENFVGSTVDYDVNCYVRFLQYDIDQSYNYVVQSPQLTR